MKSRLKHLAISAFSVSLTLASSLQAIAGSGASNGGGAWVCRENARLTRAMSYDLFAGIDDGVGGVEVRGRRAKLVISRNNATSAKEQALKAIQRIKLANSPFYALVEKTLLSIATRIEAEKEEHRGKHLAVPRDFNPRTRPGADFCGGSHFPQYETAILYQDAEKWAPEHPVRFLISKGYSSRTGSESWDRVLDAIFLTNPTTPYSVYQGNWISRHLNCFDKDFPEGRKDASAIRNCFRRKMSEFLSKQLQDDEILQDPEVLTGLEFETDRGATYVHEALYKLIRTFEDGSVSDSTKDLTALLFSDIEDGAVFSVLKSVFKNAWKVYNPDFIKSEMTQTLINLRDETAIREQLDPLKTFAFGNGEKITIDPEMSWNASFTSNTVVLILNFNGKTAEHPAETVLTQAIRHINLPLVKVLIEDKRVDLNRETYVPGGTYFIIGEDYHPEVARPLDYAQKFAFPQTKEERKRLKEIIKLLKSHGATNAS